MKIVVSLNRTPEERVPSLAWTMLQAALAAQESYRLLRRWPRSPWMTVVRGKRG